MNINPIMGTECSLDDNHELVQPFDKVVSTKQPWRTATPSPKTNAPTLNATYASFQNQPPNTNINPVPINSDLE
jgi:hypothetical protein